MGNNNGKKKSWLTPGKVVQILSLLCIIFVFCPTLMVACAGEEINISMWQAMTGQIDDTFHFELVLTLLLPVVLFVILFIRKIKALAVNIVSLVLPVVDLVIWLLFLVRVKSQAEGIGGEFHILIWYFINLLILIAMFVLPLIVMIKKGQMDWDFKSAFSGKQCDLSELGDDVIGCCSACGSPLHSGDRYCLNCGTTISESVIAEAEAAGNSAETSEKQ